MRFGLIVSEWNREITESLLNGAHAALKRHDAVDRNITVIHVPGSFELPSGAQYLANTGNYDALILLGCVIRGETTHYDHICQGVAHGTMNLNLKYNIPFIFGVLTTENLEQARDRAGGRFGNKGEEAAITAIKMVALRNKL